MGVIQTSKADSINRRYHIMLINMISKGEVSGSSLLGHLPKEFSLRLTWCPWLVGYYGTRGISRGARKLARTPSLSKKKKKYVEEIVVVDILVTISSNL